MNRRPSRRRPVPCVLVTVALAAAGCSQGGGPIFEPLDPPLLWPAPPETSRIHYVGQLTGSRDLKARKSAGATIGATIFGEGPSYSMLTPYALCTDGRGRLYVSDSNAQVVHVFDLQRRKYEQWRPDGEDVVFAQPVGVALDGQGRLLVADSVGGTIHVFDDDGEHLGEFGRGLLMRPCGLAVDPLSGRVYVADAAAHRVAMLDPDGELLAWIGTRGTALGEFNFPTNVALDSQGRLYVSDSLNFRVQVFDRDLTPIRQIGSQGDLPGYFAQPKGIALDSDDHLYVVDAHFEAVQIFDIEGALLLSFGREGSGPGEFWLPAGIHIDSGDRIWVADPYNRRVQVFDYRPEPQETAP